MVQDTAGLSKQKFINSVRFKLLLVSLTLLGIPWAGYQFIIEIEHFLRDAQYKNIDHAATSIANIFSQQPPWFNGQHLAEQAVSNNNLYLNHWPQSPTIDGYPDEWGQYKEHFVDYALPDASLSSRLAIGHKNNHLYLLLAVKDASHNYGDQGDSVDISIANENELLQRLRIQPNSPGWVSAKHLGYINGEIQPSHIELQIRGEWQETESGYTLELRIPKRFINSRFSLSIKNSEDGSQLQTSPLFPYSAVGKLVTSSEPALSLLKKLTPNNSRVWILDHEGLVLAKNGTLDSHEPLSADAAELPWLVQQLIFWTLPRQADIELELSDKQSHLKITAITEALAGRPSSLRRRVPNSDSIVVSASTAIKNGNQIMGAVFVEQTTNAILSIQNLALQRLFATTVILFLITSFALLAFASYLTNRIRRLQNQFDDAVSHDGRIIADLKKDNSQDELGGLNRSLAAVLRRLSDYNEYLEAMASRLAHELRTPLSIVKTSLDNADQTEDAAARSEYINRAHSGANRLESILKSLREATRLEQALQSAELIELDIGVLLKYQLKAFQDIYADIDITLLCSSQPKPLLVSPELICQALEKIMANAIDFRDKDSSINLYLNETSEFIEIWIENKGQALTEGMDLFKSMISVRTERSEEPHLGLGLYMVRLIAEFHKGTAFAQTSKTQSTCIGIRLPK